MAWARPGLPFSCGPFPMRGSCLERPVGCFHFLTLSVCPQECCWMYRSFSASVTAVLVCCRRVRRESWPGAVAGVGAGLGSSADPALYPAIAQPQAEEGTADGGG